MPDRLQKYQSARLYRPAASALAAKQIHQVVSTPFDIRPSTGSLKTVGFAARMVPSPLNHHLAIAADSKIHLRSGYQIQGIPNVLGDGDLAFAGKYCGHSKPHWYYR